MLKLLSEDAVINAVYIRMNENRIQYVLKGFSGGFNQILPQSQVFENCGKNDEFSPGN